MLVRRHRGHREGRQRGRGPRATSSSRTSARPTRSRRSCAASPTPTSCTSTGAVDPAGDLETINTELILADLQTLEKAEPRVEKEVRGKRSAAGGARDGPGGAGGAERRHAAGRLRHRPRADPRARPADREAVHLRLQRRRGGADDDGRKAELAALVAPAPRGVPRREDRVGADRPRPRGRRRAARLHRPDRERPRPARPHRLRHPRPADLPDRRARRRPAPGRSARAGRPPGGRRHPHRLREGLHQGRGDLLRRPRRRRLDRRGPRQGQGAASRARTTSCRTATSSSGGTADHPLLFGESRHFSPSKRPFRGQKWQLTCGPVRQTARQARRGETGRALAGRPGAAGA